MRDAWSLFDCAKCLGISFSPFCLGAVLMECEQRRLFEDEIAFLKGLEGAAGNHYTKLDCGAGTRRVAAMRLSQLNESNLLLPV